MTRSGRSDTGAPLKEGTVRRLERDLEDAIAAVVPRLGRRRLPLLPSQQTMHLMDKAAITVYESAVENQRPGD